jgi:hypothetical protein
VSDLIRNRYRGLGGIYAVVDGEVVPADEQGNPLPHTLGEDGSPVPASEPPADPTEPQE